MPTVPVYDQAQEHAQALPGFRQDSLASPAMLGAGGEAQVKIGEAELAAGTGIAAVGFAMQQKANLRKVQDTSAEYQTQLQNWQIDVQKNRTGAAADKLLDDFGTWHQKTVEELSKGLDNDAQRQAFGTVAQRTGLTARHDVATFQVTQTTKANDDAAAATSKTLVGLGAAALTNEAAQQYKGELMLNVTAYAQSKHMTPVELKQAVLDATTTFHAQRIQQLARDNPDVAAAYFKEYKDQIAGDKQAEIGKFADQATAVTIGVRGARDIFTEVGDKGLDQALKQAEDKYADKPEVFKAVTAQLHTLYAAQKTGEAARMDSAAATVLRASTAGATRAQLMAMPEFITLNTQMGEAGAKQAAAILDHQQQKAQAADSYAYTHELRQQQILSKKNDANFWRYADPNVITKMTPDQIEVLRPQIGDAHTNRLHELQNTYASRADAAGAASIDMKTFTALAEKAQMRPNEPKQTEEQKAALSRVYLNVLDRVNAAAQAKGRPLAPDEKEREIKKAFDDTVTQPGFFPWSDDTKKPVSALADDERKKAVVMVPTTDKKDGPTKPVKINDIPTDFITAAEKKAGRPLTQAEVAWSWDRSKSTWRKGDW